ncbi:hypothetical protein LTR51_008683 [Lithohypha guttulata]|nr:hypothetical protein LTR51_008683 [Lithohypha guttulata]
MANLAFPVRCPHPLCSIDVDDEVSLSDHFVDFHGMKLAPKRSMGSSNIHKASADVFHTELPADARIDVGVACQSFVSASSSSSVSYLSPAQCYDLQSIFNHFTENTSKKSFSGAAQHDSYRQGLSTMAHLRDLQVSQQSTFTSLEVFGQPSGDQRRELVSDTDLLTISTGKSDKSVPTHTSSLEVALPTSSDGRYVGQNQDHKRPTEQYVSCSQLSSIATVQQALPATVETSCTFSCLFPRIKLVVGERSASLEAQKRRIHDRDPPAAAISDQARHPHHKNQVKKRRKLG